MAWEHFHYVNPGRGGVPQPEAPDRRSPIKEFEETLIRSGLRGCCVERDIGDFYRLFI